MGADLLDGCARNSSPMTGRVPPLEVHTFITLAGLDARPFLLSPTGSALMAHSGGMSVQLQLSKPWGQRRFFKRRKRRFIGPANSRQRNIVASRPLESVAGDMPPTRPSRL